MASNKKPWGQPQGFFVLYRFFSTMRHSIVSRRQMIMLTTVCIQCFLLREFVSMTPTPKNDNPSLGVGDVFAGADVGDDGV